MAATVIKQPTELVMRVDPDGTPTEVDLCDFVVGVLLEPSADEIDVGTFCAARTALGQETWSVALSVLFSEAGYAALKAHVNTEVEMVMVPNGFTPGQAIVWRGAYGFAPMGGFNLGERVEQDLPMAVSVAPDVVTDPRT